MMTRLAAAMALVVSLASPGAAETPYPQIYDIPGDANGIQGTSVSTAPASFDPGDLLEATLETTYVAVPVGEDGIDYQETGLRISIRTTEPAGSEGPTALLYVSGTIGGCTWQFEGRVAGPLSQTWEDGPGTSTVRREMSACEQVGVEGPMESITGSELTAGVDPATGLTVLSIPFSGLGTGPARGILKPGAVLEGLSGWSFLEPCEPTGCLIVHVDHSSMASAPSFVIGEDVPPDVPCTRGCP